jgi:hypothetical protein
MEENLTIDQLNKVNELREKLPSNWVTLFLQICENDLKRRYVRQTAYKTLNECKDHLDTWKVIEGIARRHQEAMEKVA